jgi:hypothetical protein
MKSPYVVNLHNVVTVSQQRLGKRVAQRSTERANEVCAAPSFSPEATLVDKANRPLCITLEFVLTR